MGQDDVPSAAIDIYLRDVTQKINGYTHKLAVTASEETENVIQTTNEKFQNEAGLEKQDVDALVDSRMRETERKLLGGMEEIRAYLKEIMPREPKRKDFTSKAEFKKAKAEYKIKNEQFKKILKLTQQSLDDFSSTLKEVLTKLSDFLKTVWEWIKNKVNYVVEKIKEFAVWMKTRFTEYFQKSEKSFSAGKVSEGAKSTG